MGGLVEQRIGVAIIWRLRATHRQDGFTEEVGVEQGLHNVITGLREVQVEEKSDVGVEAAGRWQTQLGGRRSSQRLPASRIENPYFGQIIPRSTPVIADGHAWEAKGHFRHVDFLKNSHEAQFVADFEPYVVAQELIDQFNGFGVVGGNRRHGVGCPLGWLPSAARPVSGAAPYS